MGTLLRRIDDAVYRVERFVCLVLLAAMTAAVFLDVVHRLASTEGPLDRLFGRLALGAAGRGLQATFSLGVSVLLCYGALRTARRAHPLGKARALGLAALLTALGYAAVRGLLWIAPNGLVWSQVFALCAMLWVGFIGASIATKEGSHLSLELMEFLWRGRAKVRVGRIGAFAASAFCAVLVYLSLLHVRFHHQEWVESGRVAGTFEAFPAPRFAVFAILPCSLFIMSLRFLGRALGSAAEERATG